MSSPRWDAPQDGEVESKQEAPSSPCDVKGSPINDKGAGGINLRERQPPGLDCGAAARTKGFANLRERQPPKRAVSESMAGTPRGGQGISSRTLKLILLAQFLGLAFVSFALLGIYLQLRGGQFSASVSKETLLQSTGGRTSCRGSSLVRELHDKLHNVVLIINTNYEIHARVTATFLRAVYGRFFDRVVIMSRESIPELGVEARGQYLWRDKWQFAYWHLPKMMGDYPEAEGYLWTNDDVAINYWKLLNADTTKLWFTYNLSNPEAKHFPFDKKAKANWSDWAADKKVRKAAGEAYVAMEENYRMQFARSAEPFVGTYPKRIMDLFYIPRRFAKPLTFDLIPIFREHKIWSEVALPMMFFALDSPENFDRVLDDMIYSWEHWDKSREFDPAAYWSANVSAFHPWKLSQVQRRKQFVMSFSERDPCILELLPKLALAA